MIDYTATLPASYEGFTEEDLRYYLCLVSLERYTIDEIKLFLLLRHLPREARGLPPLSLALALKHFDFMDCPPRTPLRPRRIAGRRVVDAYLSGVPFRVYLRVENLLTGFLQSKDDEALKELLLLLTDTKRAPRCMAGVDKAAIIFWLTGLKGAYADRFPHLFKAASGTDNAAAPSPLEAMNAMLRALTGGDITRTALVLSAPTLDALTELDARAREAEEMARAYKKK